jgi:hypothetical protein
MAKPFACPVGHVPKTKTKEHMNSRFIEMTGQDRAVPALLVNKTETFTANFAGKATRFLRDQRSALVKGGGRHG